MIVLLLSLVIVAMGVWDVIKTTNPFIRAAAVAALGYVAVEAVKPGFAFAQVAPGEYVERGLKPTPIDTGDDEPSYIEGTWIPWWGVPLGLFAFFGLFV